MFNSSDKFILITVENITPKKRVNCDKCDFATKQRMFGGLGFGLSLRSFAILRYNPQTPHFKPPWTAYNVRRTCISSCVCMRVCVLAFIGACGCMVCVCVFVCVCFLDQDSE